MDDLHFNILYDLSDDLSTSDYFSFVVLNELTYELSMCQDDVIRRFEIYQSYYRSLLTEFVRYEVVADICRNDDIDVFKWIHHNIAGYQRISNGCYELVIEHVIVNNDQSTIEWSCNIGPEIRRMCAIIMASGGKLDMLKWLQFRYDFFDHDERCGYDIMDSACRSGNIDIVKWLYEIQSESLRIGFYDKLEYSGVINYACQNGHYDIVMFFIGESLKGCIPPPKCSEENLAHAIKNERSDMAEILYANFDELRTVDMMVRLVRRYYCLDTIKFACNKLESLSPLRDPKSIRAFVKNRITGHFIKIVKNHEMIDWLVEAYGFKDPRKK